MMSLSDFALRRPVTLLMVYAALFILGGLAILKIPLEFLLTVNNRVEFAGSGGGSKVNS